MDKTKARSEEKVSFRYVEHPGDLFRNTDVMELPNPKLDLESFLVQFLPHYQSDLRIAQLNDLLKLLEDDFSDESAKQRQIEVYGVVAEKEISSKVKLLEEELTIEAYKNFYHQLQSKQLEIVSNVKDQ